MKDGTEKHAVPAVILETDFCSDVDDVGAMAILFDAASHGRIRLIGVSVNVNGPMEAAAAKVLLGHWGLQDVPVAVWNGKNGPRGAESAYVPYLAGLLKERDREVLKPLAPEAFYREVLAGEADGGVTVISIGFFCSLAAALRDDPELFERRVSRVVAMAGSFREKEGYREFNVTQMQEEAAAFIGGYRGEMIFIASETGDRVITDLNGPERFAEDPVFACYRLHTKGSMKRPSWDLVAVDWALYGEGDWYGLSESGQVTVMPDGTTPFRPSADGKHRYLLFRKSHEEIGRHITDILVQALKKRASDAPAD